MQCISLLSAEPAFSSFFVDLLHCFSYSQVDGPYGRTVAFDIDQIGVFTMEIKRRVDLASIQHVNTRGAPEYTVILPGGGKAIGEE